MLGVLGGSCQAVWEGKRTQNIVAAIFLISLLARALALWFFPETHLSDNAITAYLGAAQLLRTGEGMLDPSYPVFAPPLYAVLIAFLQTLFGDGQLPIKFAQVTVDSATSVILFFIMKELFTARVGSLAGLVYSIYPFSIYASTYIGSETFFTFFLSIFVLLFIVAVKYQKWQFWVAAGVTLGVTTMTRGTTQFFPLFVGLLLFKSKKGQLLRDMRNYLLFCFCFILILLPWTIRNYLVLHEFVPVATAASVFQQGSAERFLTIDGKNKELPKWYEHMRARGIPPPPPGASAVQRDRFQLRAGLESYWDQATNDPWSLVSFLLMKFARLWYATESGRNHSLIFASNVGIYLLGLGGLIILLVRKHPFSWILSFVIGYMVLLHWVSLPLFRYILPIMPYVIGLAVVGGMTIMEFINGKWCYKLPVDRETKKETFWAG